MSTRSSVSACTKNGLLLAKEVEHFLPETTTIAVKV
jgi:hypothetical protein